MKDRRYVDELSLDELEAALRVRRREERMRRLEGKGASLDPLRELSAPQVTPAGKPMEAVSREQFGSRYSAVIEPGAPRRARRPRVVPAPPVPEPVVAEVVPEPEPVVAPPPVVAPESPPVVAEVVPEPEPPPPPPPHPAAASLDGLWLGSAGGRDLALDLVVASDGSVGGSARIKRAGVVESAVVSGRVSEMSGAYQLELQVTEEGETNSYSGRLEGGVIQGRVAQGGRTRGRWKVAR